MEIRTSPKFERQYKKLPLELKDKAKEAEAKFRANPFDARLDTHKLHGKEAPHWAFSITRKYRVKFLSLGNGEVMFVEVGTHDGVYR